MVASDGIGELPRVLCKYRGMLAIAGVSVRTDCQAGRCPECGATSFSERNGWSECDCGFAYLSSDVQRVARPCRTIR